MKRLLIMLMVIGLVTGAQAWTLIENFDSGMGTFIVDTDDSHVSASSGTLVIDKLAGSGGWDGAYMDLTGTGAELAVGETKTYFWQAWLRSDWETTSWAIDCMMGLSPETTNIDQIDAWQDFAVMPFLNNSPQTPFINAVAPTEPWWAPMDPATWYNVWVVVNNDATAPSYDLYYSTGTDAAVMVADDAFWRGSETGIGPGSALNALGFMAGGWDLTSYRFENVYYADGVDTSLASPIPEPATMALLGLGSLVMLRKRK